jgi:fibronectin-binding autotransporter adhesin
LASQVSVFALDGTFKGSFSPYGGFPGGVNVGVGDVDGDTVDEIVTAADAGGGPHVIVWDWNNSAHTATAKYGWYAYDPGFKGGVNISVADVVGSTRADIVTAPGAGGGPHVRIWDLGTGAAVENMGWMAYAPSFTGGVRVSAGEIDGARAVVTGPGPGGGPHVRLFNTSGMVSHEFMAYDTAYHGGVNLLLSAAQGGDLGHVITAPASWGGPHVRAFTSSGQVLWEFMAYGGNPINGVTLARIPQNGTSNNTNQNGSTSSSGG